MDGKTVIRRANDYAGAVELRQLSHFVAVAEEGSFTRAARRLNYVQSALSVSVQALERELGVRLFDRTTHRVTLTGPGEAILPAARRTLSAADETRDVAAAVQGVLRGRLRVGIMQSFAFADVPGVLGQFHRLHPYVEIHVQPSAGGSAAIVEELRQGSLDIAFIALVDRPAGVKAIPLGSEHLAFVSAPDQAPAGRRRPVPRDAVPRDAVPRDAVPRDAVRLGSLADATFVDFPTGWGVRTVVDQAFAAAGVARRVTMEIADVAIALQLIRAGLGVAVIPPSLVPPGDTGLVQRPISPQFSWHVVMATPSSATNAAAQALAELVISATDVG
jgi:DNA-binding transcriptional LysR family regulator